MAGKKYRPALYELVGKGPLKPDKGGKLLTPKWFYGSRTGTVTPLGKDGKGLAVKGLKKRLIPPTVERPKDWEDESAKAADEVVEDEAVVDEAAVEQAGQATVEASGMSEVADAPAVAHTEGQASAPEAQAAWSVDGAKEKVRQVGGRLTKEKVEVSATYMSVAVFLVGLLFSWVLFYGLGHMAGGTGGDQAVEREQSAAEPAAQGRLADVLSGPPRPDVLASASRADGVPSSVRRAAIPRPGQLPPANRRTVAPTEAAVQAVAASAAVAASNKPAVPVRAAEVKPAVKVVDKGSRLVVLTWRSPAELSPVMAFFAKKGIETEVGRFGTKFVLFTKESFGTGDDVRVREVKEDIRRYGALYRDEKPATAPIFLAQSFAQAYPVKSDSIKRLSD